MRQRILPSALALAILLTALLAACTSESDRLYRRAKDAASEEGDLEYAIELVNEAILVNPEDGRYHRRLGSWLEELGRHEEALAAFDAATQAADPSTSAHLKAIELCIRLERYDEAQRRIDAAAGAVEDLDELEALQAELRRAMSVESQTEDAPSEPQNPEQP